MQPRTGILLIGVIILLCTAVQPVTAIMINGTNFDDATYYFNKCDDLITAGDFARAHNFCVQALASNTSMLKKSDALAYVYNDKSFAEIQMEMFTDAVGTTNQGLSLYPEDPILWNNNGYAHYKLGQYQEAITSYDKAISYQKDANKLSKYLRNKGDALYSLNRYADAIDAYQKALVQDPSNTVASEGLIKAQQQAGAGTQIMVFGVLAVVIIAGVAGYFLMRKKEVQPEEKQSKK